MSRPGTPAAYLTCAVNRQNTYSAGHEKLQSTMNLSGRLGISVAIVAMFTLLLTEVFQGKDFYQVYRWGICAALLAAGAFLLVVGRFVNTRIRDANLGEGDEAAKGPFLLLNLEYWGLILTIFGLLVIFIVPYKRVEARALARRTNAPPVKKIAVTNQVPAAPPAAIPPDFKLQGIILNQGRPSALIGGRTYFVSNRVGDARLIAVTPTNALLEIEGQPRALPLGD